MILRWDSKAFSFGYLFLMILFNSFVFAFKYRHDTEFMLRSVINLAIGLEVLSLSVNLQVSQCLMPIEASTENYDSLACDEGCSRS